MKLLELKYSGGEYEVNIRPLEDSDERWVFVTDKQGNFLRATIPLNDSYTQKEVLEALGSIREDFRVVKDKYANTYLPVLDTLIKDKETQLNSYKIVYKKVDNVIIDGGESYKNGGYRLIKMGDFDSDNRPFLTPEKIVRRFQKHGLRWVANGNNFELEYMISPQKDFFVMVDDDNKRFTWGSKSYPIMYDAALQTLKSFRSDKDFIWIDDVFDSDYGGVYLENCDEALDLLEILLVKDNSRNMVWGLTNDWESIALKKDPAKQFYRAAKYWDKSGVKFLMDNLIFRSSYRDTVFDQMHAWH